MQADWEVEIGGEAPAIEAPWVGFVDLQQEPEKAAHLAESTQLPALAAALVRLNAPDSSWWTSKCDVFPVADFDRDELDAPRESVAAAMACYIDLLPRNSEEWTHPDHAVLCCRNLCARLHEIPLRSCRADLVVRRAFLSREQSALGMTAYLTACGDSIEDASSRLGSALAGFADAVVQSASRACIRSPLQ
jgi:hypothetical protein